MTALHALLARVTMLLIVVLTACAPAAGVPSASVSSSAAGDSCVNAYYPISAKASWSYSSTGNPSMGAYTFSRTIAAQNNAGFTSSDQYSTGVKWTVEWTCKDGNLTAMDTGPGTASMTTSRVNMSNNSVTAEGYSIPASFEADKTWSESVSIRGPVNSNGKQVASSQIDARITCHFGGSETLTVPAGKFDTVIAICSKNVVVSAVSQGTRMQLGANHENITYWYAKGVGLVKSVASGGTDNETVVLTTYQMP